METRNFNIPSRISELLDESSEYFIVWEVVAKNDILSKLKDAKVVIREQGAEGIIDVFSTYYSILRHGEALQMDTIYKAYEDLHKVFVDLNRALGFLLEDKESLNDEVKLKFVNILKMLTYIYTQIIILIEDIHEKKREDILKGRKKASKEQTFAVDKKKVILSLMNVVEREINLFWNPPVVEGDFIKLISEVCYRFLQNPMIKSEKEVCDEIFNLIGMLIKNYGHGTNFVIRLVQLVKNYEHIVHYIPEGVKRLVQNFNCKGLVHDLISEMTEWQTDEKYQDSQGGRYCASVLSSMAVLMPDLMIPEIMYLNKYLNHESPTLRNSVLTVIAEVIINVLSSHDLSEEQKESRDDLLSVLSQHIFDVSAVVRSKVMHHWARLQKESAIPLKCQNEVLEKVLERLYDKGAMVRKNAINCVTTFLTHNPFSANLSLLIMQEELDHKKKLLDSIRGNFANAKVKHLEEIEARWNSKKDELTAVIEEELKKGDAEERSAEAEKENEENPIPQEQMSEIIRLYLNENKFKEAFKLCKMAGDQIEEFTSFRQQNECETSVSNPQELSENEKNEVQLYLMVLHSVFLNVNKLIEELKAGNIQGAVEMTVEDFQKMEVLESRVEFLENCVRFMTLIDNAFAPMVELLETTSIGDMQEAVQFFISAYQFNIDNASVGILAMLNMMKRNEQERKDYIVNAFKTVYLTTDTSNMGEHCTLIVNRLIALVKTVPFDNIDDLQLIISEWTAKGVLDNNIIDMLWQYFTKRVSVTDDDARASVDLLKMCAMGRKTIISKNIKLVSMIAFGERGENDMLLLGSACELLAVAGERVDITSKNPPFRIKYHDDMFKTLLELLCKKFFEPVEYYSHALFGGIALIYKLCSKPERLCETLLKTIVNRMASISQKADHEGFDKYIVTRICQFLGFVALKHLEYLDETIYKELKRRSNIREERKQAKKTSKKGKPPAKRKSALSASTANNSTMNTSLVEESTLEGAQAEDTDAEFILNVLENDTVTGSGGLGKLFYIVKTVCERPKVYDDVMIQGAAVIALIRYMLVSSRLCSQNIQLLFTIFEKSEYPEVKCTILLHLSDLLTRFPNIIEPWTPRICQSLQDPLSSVRRATFFTLSKLILSDMIRAHSHLSMMACCLVDADKELTSMSKTFLINLSHKENNLYNVLPDIFSHLMEVKDTVTDENVRYIMQFLFDLMDKAKHMENLVDRFCCKFRLSEDVRHHRHISFCLALIHYNEKALRKLIENFPIYKHLVHDPEIYGSFKSIMQSCNKVQAGKVDLKVIVSELEKLIGSVFELDEDGNRMRPPTAPPKSTRKPRAKSAKRKGPNRRKQDSDSDEDFEKENVDVEATVRRSGRAKRKKNVVDDLDSD